MVDGVVEDGVCFDVMTAHTEAKPVVRCGDVHQAGVVNVRERERQGEFVLVPQGFQVFDVSLVA